MITNQSKDVIEKGSLRECFQELLEDEFKYKYVKAYMEENEFQIEFQILHRNNKKIVYKPIIRIAKK